jgi:cytochrome c biogenesis protein CcmG, thiol:disulfide interchange protein DsbE
VVAGFYLAHRHGSVQPLNLSNQPLAPDFSVTDLNQHDVQLSAYRGKVVLLNFWATWCEPCRKEIPRFIEFQNQYGPRGLQVLGISLDDDSKPVYKFRDEFKVDYPIAIGNAKLAESYGGVLGLPISFVIDPQGRIVAKHIGAVDLSKIEQEIQRLLPQSGNTAPGGGV